MRKRGFEVISRYCDQDIHLPKRATHHAAGYDIEACEDIVVPSFWNLIFQLLKERRDLSEIKEEVMKPTLVPTGLKCYMQADEYLQLTCRSSNPLKRYLMLPNGVGIIDADYYNNEGNEGHIYVQLLNFGLLDAKVKKGERIAQGIFLSFLKTDNDETEETRQGGFGSSGRH